MKPKEVLIILAFTLLLLGTGFAVTPLTLMGAVNTTSQFGSFAGVQGVSAPEILDHRYVTAWSGEGESEDIAANVGLKWTTAASGAAGVRITEARYEYVVFDTNQEVVIERIFALQTTLFPQELRPGQPFFMGIDRWTIIGPVVGTLEFTFVAKYEVCETGPADVPCSWSEPRTNVFARDTALLLPGADGMVNAEDIASLLGALINPDLTQSLLHSS